MEMMCEGKFTFIPSGFCFVKGPTNISFNQDPMFKNNI